MEAGTLYESVGYENFLEALRVSKKLDTPANVLVELSTNVSPTVRAAVAANPNTPSEVIKILAFDKDTWVHSAALRNPFLPLKDLVGCDSSQVRASVAIHPKATFDVLVQLVGDVSPAVASAAKYQLENFDDNLFRSSLIEYSFGQLVGLPRAWAMKILCSGGYRK